MDIADPIEHVVYKNEIIKHNSVFKFVTTVTITCEPVEYKSNGWFSYKPKTHLYHYKRIVTAHNSTGHHPQQQVERSFTFEGPSYTSNKELLEMLEVAINNDPMEINRKIDNI